MGNKLWLILAALILLGMGVQVYEGVRYGTLKDDEQDRPVYRGN